MGLSSPVSRPFGRGRMWIPWSWRYWTVLSPSERFLASRSIRGTTTTSQGWRVSLSVFPAGRRIFRPEATSVKMRRWVASPLSPPAWETRM